MERLTGNPIGPGMPQWADLYGDLLQAHRDADLLVNGLTNDTLLPLDLYRRVIVLKERWVDYRGQQVMPERFGENAIHYHTHSPQFSKKTADAIEFFEKSNSSRPS
jgi:hypothetical protein